MNTKLSLVILLAFAGDHLFASDLGQLNCFVIEAHTIQTEPEATSAFGYIADHFTEGEILSLEYRWTTALSGGMLSISIGSPDAEPDSTPYFHVLLSNPTFMLENLADLTGFSKLSGEGMFGKDLRNMGVISASNQGNYIFLSERNGGVWKGAGSVSVRGDLKSFSLHCTQVKDVLNNVIDEMKAILP